jgi:hypothetical protein
MDIRPVALFEAVKSDVSEYYRDKHASIPDITYKQFASSYLLDSVIRKWIPSDTKEADANALSAFMTANSRCRDWKFSEDDFVLDYVLGETKRIIDDFLHPHGETLIGSYYDLWRSGRPGPGASVGGIGTSYYSKYFASPLASTSDFLYRSYTDYCSWIPTMSDAEKSRYDMYGMASVVSGSRCSFVPKTAKSSRMICVEPSLNMFAQLGLATHLEERLKSFFGIDLSTQPLVNHRLAQLGSKDGTYCTIDLTSASDSISLRLCELLFPKWFFELLLVLRSRTTKIGSKHVPLYMISTMGNGFTFPLQTLIFSSIVKACMNLKHSSGLEFSVYGDDIIVHRSLYELVIKSLRAFNFIPNPDKTFFEGPFRESCGADWFLGQPVRPVFIRRMKSAQDVTVAVNLFNEWSAYTGIPLRNTIAYLLTILPAKLRCFVPFDSNQDAGIRVPLSLLTKPRYDKNMSFVFKTLERVPSKMSISDKGIRTPRGMRRPMYNPFGLYYSNLFGELRNNIIMVRHDLKKYCMKLRCSPYWDYIPSKSLSNGIRLSWQQWETAVVRNHQTL